MDGFKRPPPKGPEIKRQTPAGDDIQRVFPSEPTPQDDEIEDEADEAVVAGVTAIGGLALKWQHVKKFFKRWWDNKKLRYGTLGGLLAVLIVLFVVPMTRYGILNAVGMRVSASVAVIDDETGLPLKNASVHIGQAEALSDDSGQARLSGVRLGDQDVLITKPGYGDYLQPMRIGVGGNELDEARMTATGTRFVFRLSDWHSGQPMGGVLAETDDGSSAFSDEEGLLKLVTPPSDQPIEITFSHDGYNATSFATEPANFEEQPVTMVEAGYSAFISKRDGEFDLYRSNLDGSDVEKIVEATGKERASSLALSLDPSGAFAGMVSTRDGQRNEDGFVLSGLYIVDLETGEMNRIDTSESIELIGWSDERLVYMAQTSGESGYSPERFRLRSYKAGSMAAETLETSNYFYGTILADGRVYYAPGESFRQNRPPEHFMSVRADGSDHRTHLESRTVRIARTDFDSLVLETVTSDLQQEWFSFSLGTQGAVKLDGQPVSFEYWNDNAEFVSSPDGNWLAWQEERDGQDVIMLRDGGGAERVLASLDGAQGPIRWLGDDLVIFRIVKSGESADYIISLADGAEPEKLADVTDVAGH